ncbi:MAG: alkaline phosphatase [Balneolales bacterium]|nr:alkaline phosphatase [Balneolales bacterium]
MNQNKTNPALDRRQFLKMGALTSAFAGFSVLSNGCSLSGNGSASSYKGKAKYVIFLVSDGMSHGTLQMADLMSRRKLGKPTKWISLYEQGKLVRGLMDMTTGNSSVPDSAAAASSWGCGKRIYNGNVNMDEDGTEFEPVLPIFARNGFKTGLVTSAEVTHATPAGFAANVPGRWEQDRIAEQYLDREFDLILGGGYRHFKPDYREDGKNILQGFKDKGYHVSTTKQELGNPDGFKRCIGTFTERHLPYQLDHDNDQNLRASVPTLRELSEFALETLYASGDGFILQIEGARVDHAAHSMDAPGLIYDQIEFDNAIDAAWDFYERHPDETLIIITTDHGNANPALNAAGSRYDDSEPFFDRIQEFRYTNNWIMQNLNDGSSVSDILERVGTATNLDFTRDHARMMQQALRGEFRAAYAMKERPMNVLGDLMSNYTSVAFTGSVHTADYVELAAAGPGSETIGPITRNTDLFFLMLEAAGIEERLSVQRNM